MRRYRVVLNPAAVTVSGAILTLAVLVVGTVLFCVCSSCGGSDGVFGEDVPVDGPCIDRNDPECVADRDAACVKAGCAYYDTYLLSCECYDDEDDDEWPERYDEAGACDDCDKALDGMCDENGGDCTAINCGTTRTVDYRGKVTCGKDCKDDSIAFVECGVTEEDRDATTGK